jgi:hypothetical protein
MTKQFLLAAAPPPRGGGILLQLSSKQLAKPTAFGALTAANDAPGAFREHGRREKSDPIAARERSLATLYPSKSSLIVIPTARQVAQAKRPWTAC